MKSLQRQPPWTKYFFKVSFSMYMLVSVIILINLLIAMMSDTYQSIVSQSDIEWKYGLSKLIRNMQKTKTAPSPLNLFSTWITHLVKLCKRKRANKKKKSIMQGFIAHSEAMSKRTLMRNKIVPQQSQLSSLAFPGALKSPAASQLSIRNMPKIDTVVDWDIARRKYRMLVGDLVEKPSSDMTNTDESIK